MHSPVLTLHWSWVQSSSSKQSALLRQHDGSGENAQRLTLVSQLAVKHVLGGVQSDAVSQQLRIASCVHVPPAQSSNVHTSPSSQSATVVHEPPYAPALPTPSPASHPVATTTAKSSETRAQPMEPTPTPHLRR